MERIVVVIRFLMRHVWEFLQSGIKRPLRRRAGVRSVTAEMARKYSGLPCGKGWAAPVRDKQGKALLMLVKPDRPYIFKDGRVAKYLWPLGAQLHIYYPPGASAFLDDVTIPITLTEGLKKTLAAVQYGFPAVGLNGVWCWREDGRPLPDLEDIAWKDRIVFLTFDSDVLDKWQVLQALRHLSFELERRGARVRIVRLPKLTRTGKTGLDDFLVAKGAQAYRDLQSAATTTIDFHMFWLASCSEGERGDLVTRLLLDVKKHAPILRREYEYAVTERFGFSRRDLTAAVKHAEVVAARSDSHVVDPHFYAVGLMNTTFTHNHDATLRFFKEVWWIWEGLCYRRLLPKEFIAVINRELRLHLDVLGQQEIEVNTNLVANVVQALSASCLVNGDTLPIWLGKEDVPTDRYVLPMKNGLLNLEAVLTGEAADALLPHSPNWFSLAAWPFDFVPSARCPMWMKFIRTAMRDRQDLISIIQEFLGYCMTFDTSLERFLVLIGGGANGKTVLTDVFTQVLGATNVTHLGLEQFGDRFALARTIGRLANIVNEVSSVNDYIEGIIKAIVSGNRISVEFKNHTPFDANPTIRLILATNTIPKFKDKSQGIWRRMIIIPFEHEVPPEEQDPLLAKKICQTELPGVFAWAIEGLRRLRINGGFTKSDIVRQAVEQHRTDSDPDRQFLEEHYRFEATGRVKCDDVYRHYKRVFNFRQLPISSKGVFGKTIHFMYPKVKHAQCREANGTREYYYLGLRTVAR